MSNIVVLDYGSSNLRSVAKALETVANSDQSIAISNHPDEILKADKVVFPGQGAIGQCMTHLKKQELEEVIRECILNKPFLGICLGLQSLMDHSDEDGGVNGLGVIPGNVVRFSDNQIDENGDVYKIPSMGWNQVIQKKQHPLWEGIEDRSRFYFVHSFYVKPELDSDIVGSTDYICQYTSAVARDNLFATQFHPEKSQYDGLRLLKNFLNWQV
ncbi:MAG: imidazole glycerol phosphate synthase subunit HisH [Legionellales bacterium]|nr:imidazole glycerol phosphate synthase subunit HisH [Legionellales bacterium]|tara:strand:+ start:1013 stop:1654 length:642 start_codon:yes stop_codon:yes gene_type:complete